MIRHHNLLLSLISGILLFSPTSYAQTNGVCTNIGDAMKDPLAVRHLKIGVGGSPLNLKWFTLSKMVNMQDASMHLESFSNVPDEFANLKLLRSMKLEFYGRQTVFPDEFCSLPVLEELSVRRGSFGELPPNFGRLSHLRTLDFHIGNLRNLPGSLGNLDSLETADFSGNRIAALPSTFGNLKMLRTLNLRQNQLTSLPRVIGGLQSLQALSLRGNRIGCLPDEMGMLSKLRVLSLSDNRISDLPSSFYGLTNLQKLDLSANHLGEISPDIKFFANLRYLDLSFNRLKALPDSVSALTHLKDLEIYGNQFPPSEVDNIRILLPNCVIHADSQNVLARASWPASWKEFRDDSTGISFFYPEDYVLGAVTRDTTVERIRYELFVSMAMADTGSMQMDTTEYFVASGAELTVSVGTMDFYDVARGSGFERDDPAFEDSTAFDDGSSEFENRNGEGWVSEGRQGMTEPVSVISFEDWMGMEGTNYTGTFGEDAEGNGSGYLGLREFFTGFAFHKGAHRSVAVSFFYDTSGQEEVFHQVLSSFKFIEK